MYKRPRGSAHRPGGKRLFIKGWQIMRNLNALFKSRMRIARIGDILGADGINLFLIFTTDHAISS